MDKKYLEIIEERFMKHVEKIGRDMIDEVMEKLIGKREIKDLTVEEMIKLLDILDSITGEDGEMTNKQRKLFFWYAKQIGEENARDVMYRVTGKRSLKECTKNDMIRVLDELINLTKIYPDRGNKRHKKRRSKKASAIQRGGERVVLPSKKMQMFLEDLIRKVYGENIERFENLCRRMIGIKRPVTKDEVWIMIQALKKIKEKQEMKEKGREWIN